MVVSQKSQRIVLKILCVRLCPDVVKSASDYASWLPREWLCVDARGRKMWGASGKRIAFNYVEISGDFDRLSALTLSGYS